MSVIARVPSNGMVLDGLSSAGNGLAHGHVREIQRARMVAAMGEVCAERGVGNVTVAQVVARSGVSRRTFYELFDDGEECFLAALDDALMCAAGYVLPAYRTDGRWRDRIRAAVTALLLFLEDEPFMGRLIVLETLSAGAGALRRRSQVLARVVAAVDEGRFEARAGRDLPPLIAEGLVGGVFSVLHSRLLDPDHGSLMELIGPLMSMIVLPYLGAAAARKELARPVQVCQARRKPVPANPLRDLGMRLTYRTVRVLMAVAAQPGSSNREIGLASGVEDQGQISKLLSRLHKLGLIENTGAGQARGAPNAWTLTQKGTEIEEAIGEPTGG